MFRIFGVVLIVAALAAAVIPAFTDCQSQGKAITLASGKTVPMKCHWTGKAEIVAAVPLVGIGAMMTFTRKRQNLMGLSVLGIILGGAVMALPNDFLIGVCTTPGMICNSVMKPALLSLGGVVAALSAVGLVVSARSKKDI